MTASDLRSARLVLGMTQRQLAAVLGIRSGERTIRNMETGKSPVSGPVAVAVGFLVAEKSRQEGNSADTADTA